MRIEQKPESWTRTYIAKGVIGCFGGLVLHCVIGSFYQWSMINLYVTSYFKTFEPALTLESNAIAFPLMMFCYGLTMRIGTYLTEIIHPLIVLSGVTLLYSASVFIASFMSTMWSFLVFYDILFGLFIGMVFMIPVVQCNKYFPGKKLYVNGCVLAGTGFGPAIFGQFSYNFLNPNQLKPIDGYYLGRPDLESLIMAVPILIKYLSLFYLCLGFIAILMMTPVIIHNRRVHKEKKQKERLAKQQRLKLGLPAESQVKPIRPNEANTLKDVFTSWVCWRQFIITLLLSTGLYLMNGNYKTYVKQDINDDAFLTSIGVAGSVINGISRFIWSLIFSKTGYKSVGLGIVGISILVFAVIRFTVFTKGAYMFMIMLVNFGVGGIQVSNPSLVQYMFGQKMGEDCYGFFWCTVATANFIEFVYVSQLGLVLQFNYLIYICLGMSICVIPIILLSTFKGPWKNSTEYLEYCIKCRKRKNTIVPLNDTFSRESFHDQSPAKKTKLTFESLSKSPKNLRPINENLEFGLQEVPNCDQSPQKKVSNLQQNNSSLLVYNEQKKQENVPLQAQSSHQQ